MWGLHQHSLGGGGGGPIKTRTEALKTRLVVEVQVVPASTSFSKVLLWAGAVAARRPAAEDLQTRHFVDKRRLESGLRQLMDGFQLGGTQVDVLLSQPPQGITCKAIPCASSIKFPGLTFQLPTLA